MAKLSVESLPLSRTRCVSVGQAAARLNANALSVVGRKRPRLLSLTCYRRVINVCKWAQGVRFDSWKLQWRVGVIYFLLLFLHSAAEVSIFTVVFFVCLVLLISIPSGWCSSMQISSGYRSQLLETERANWCHFEFQIESAEFLKSRIGLNIS